MARRRKGEGRGGARRESGVATPPSSTPSPAATPAAAPRPQTPSAQSPPTRTSSAASSSRFEQWLSAKWVLPAVLVLAAAFRLAHVMALSQTPFFENLGLDPLVYDEWGQRIAAGDWIGSRIFYQDPLYPYFLGVLYAIFGRHLMLVYLLQVGFGVATCWLTGLLGRRMFGVATGNLAALMSALFLPSIFYEAQIEKTFLSVFLVAAFLVLVLDPRMGARMGAGAVLALASLTRANLILFIPAGVGMLLFERLGRRSRHRSAADQDTPPSPVSYDFLRMPEERGMRQAAAFFAGAALVLLPIVLRNYYVEGQWVLTTSQAGQNFYIGNNPMNTTGSYIVPPSIRPDPRYEETDFRAAAEKATGRKLTPQEVSQYWWDLSFEHMRKDPVFAQMMMLRKFMVFWNDYEIPDNLNMYLLERWSWVLRLPLLGIGALTALAVLGGAVWFREKVEVRILVGFTAIYCVTVVAFFVFSRYRIQIVPVLVVLAAAAVLWLEQQVRRARWENVAGGSAAILMAGFFCFQRFDFTDRDKAIAISLNNLGAVYAEQGDTPKAIATYEEAVALAPAGVVGAMRILGDYYLKAGDFARAEQYMRQVITHKPESQMGWNALVALYTTMRAKGAGDSTTSDKLALALLSAGRGAEARRVVEEARAAGNPPSDEVEQRLAQGR
jgi:hypothetical protein